MVQEASISRGLRSFYRWTCSLSGCNLSLIPEIPAVLEFSQRITEAAMWGSGVR